MRSHFKILKGLIKASKNPCLGLHIISRKDCEKEKHPEMFLFFKPIPRFVIQANIKVFTLEHSPH